MKEVTTPLRYWIEFGDARPPAWARELDTMIQSIPGFRSLKTREDTQVLFTNQLQESSVPGFAKIHIVAEGESLPEGFFLGKIDALLTYPFREGDFVSTLKNARESLKWQRVRELSARLSVVTEALEKDLDLTERLQKALLPKRFADPKGFRIYTRYVAGLKPGGDYFDLLGNPNSGSFSLLLTDSSSYSLSSAVLAVLMRAAIRVGGGDAKSVRSTVQKIRDDLFLFIGERDHLSLFYGQFSPAEKKLTYVSLGTARLFIAPQGGVFEAAGAQGGPLKRETGFIVGEPQVIELKSDDRLLIVSDGFSGGVADTMPFLSEINAKRSKDGSSFLNDLAFKAKTKKSVEEGFPEEDASAILLDVEPIKLRLQT